MPTSQSSGLAPGRQTSVVVLTDCLEKPSLDDRDYRVVRLENELEALLVHDPETDKASAALDVNVGNFSDEEGMPGMAHAVEHVGAPPPSFNWPRAEETTNYRDNVVVVHGDQEIPRRERV